MCFKLDMANECLNSKFDILNSFPVGRDICFSMFIIYNKEKVGKIELSKIL